VKNGVSSIRIDKNRIDKKRREVFIPPKFEEVEEYCKERKNSIDAQHFIDFYTSKGWMVGKNKMKDWKAAVRTWEKNQLSKKDSLSVAPVYTDGKKSIGELA
jgi:hypothetical protein